MAITTARCAVVTGVMTRLARCCNPMACLLHTRAHTPQPRHRSSLTLAFLRLWWYGSPAETMPIASTGHTSAHFMQPEHLSSAIVGRKLVVLMGFSTAKRLAANMASQQQPQQLQIKATRSR